jgi:GNAT superfamily N-acetyltransferase
MQFNYVEMTCQLDNDRYDERLPIEGIRLEDLNKLKTEDLFECYTQSFNHGDAIFYQRQSPTEKRRYFDEELGFPVVLDNPASFAYFLDGDLIGFALVMPYMESNYHISCMCILPKHQGRGLGKAMLNRIKNVSLANGCRTLSLGTEPNMKAYHLYASNGFEVTARHVVDM